LEQLVLQLLQSARVQTLVFVFLLVVFAAPCYMAYRIEQAVYTLANRMECGTKIKVTTTEVSSQGVVKPNAQ